MEKKLKLCGCKGIRTCLICEKEEQVSGKPKKSMAARGYTFCSPCGGLGPAESSHQAHTLQLEGVLLLPEFVSQQEEAEAVRRIDRIPWRPSQSGRRKQDFGPKVNFKKRKVKMGSFAGFPDFAARIASRLSLVQQLSRFRAVELCHLEYSPERGSAIEPHLDDAWLWGEHLVTLNLLSETVLILTPAEGESAASCDCHEAFRPTPVSSPPQCPIDTKAPSSEVEVRVPMPRRSLLVLFGCARHHWYHEIRRSDVTSRRLAMTFRELSRDFLHGGAESPMGEELLKVAQRIVDV